MFRKGRAGSNPASGTSSDNNFPNMPQYIGAMNTIEQRKKTDELKPYHPKMDRADAEIFGMIAKRIKDDEDLDKLTQEKLETLHRRYVVRKSKQDAEELWKKLTGGSSKDKGD